MWMLGKKDDGLLKWVLVIMFFFFFYCFEPQESRMYHSR